MIKFDGHDNAIIGPALIWGKDGTRTEVLVYDAEIIRSNLILDSGNKMTSEEAREYIEFNIEGGYLGEDTPIVVWTQDEWSDWT